MLPRPLPQVQPNGVLKPGAFAPPPPRSLPTFQPPPPVAAAPQPSVRVGVHADRLL